MTTEIEDTALRRKARAAGAEDVPGAITPARALRLAFARAAESAVDLRLSVQGVRQELRALDAMTAEIGAEDVVVGLVDASGALRGLATLDPEMRAALIEMQTTGALSPAAADPRPVTGIDSALAAPVLDAFFAELLPAAAPTALAGWTEGVRCSRRLDGARAAGLILPEADYRLVQLGIDLGVGERQGRLLVALPDRRTAPPEETAGPWRAALEEAVSAAPAELRAVLHRMRLPLSQVEEAGPGTVLPLFGAALDRVRLEGPDGALAAEVRLGQVSGMRAVRLQEAAPPLLEDAVPVLAMPEGGGGQVPEGLPGAGEGGPALDMADTTPDPGAGLPEGWGEDGAGPLEEAGAEAGFAMAPLDLDLDLPG